MITKIYQAYAYYKYTLIVICPKCSCDWWNETCLNCNINIYLYETDKNYREKHETINEQEVKRHNETNSKQGIYLGSVRKSYG
jgi:Zn-finger nucleic acid-binding protein